MKNRPMLELQLHLVNGNTHRFMQNDPELVQEMLSQIHHRVFSQPTLIVAGESQIRVYQVSSIAGITIIMDHLPIELLILDRAAPSILWETTHEEYAEKQRYALPQPDADKTSVFSEVEMTNGRKFCIETQVSKSESGTDVRNILNYVFKLPNMICRRRGGGGISIWNRAHIVSLSFSPKPEAQLVSWPADFMTEPSLDRKHALARLRSMNTLRRTETLPASIVDNGLPLTYSAGG